MPAPNSIVLFTHETDDLSSLSCRMYELCHLTDVGKFMFNAHMNLIPMKATTNGMFFFSFNYAKTCFSNFLKNKDFAASAHAYNDSLCKLLDTVSRNTTTLKLLSWNISAELANLPVIDICTIRRSDSYVVFLEFPVSSLTPSILCIKLNINYAHHC